MIKVDRYFGGRQVNFSPEEAQRLAKVVILGMIMFMAVIGIFLGLVALFPSISGELGMLGVSLSNLAIFSTRRAWRPPSNSVSSQILTMRSSNSPPSRSAERHRTLASLCRRLISAVMLS